MDAPVRRRLRRPGSRHCLLRIGDDGNGRLSGFHPDRCQPVEPDPVFDPHRVADHGHPQPDRGKGSERTAVLAAGYARGDSAGQDTGLSAGESMISAAAADGYYAILTKSFGSQIRGGESSCRLRLSTGPVLNPGGTLDVALALNWPDFLRFG